MTAAALLFSAALAVHPQHVTLAEAEWNDQSRSLEVALSITPSQLEEAVAAHAGRDVDIDADDEPIAAWLRVRFVLLPPAKTDEKEEARKPAKLKYVGQELGVSRGWVYFEVPLPGGWEGVEVRNAIRLRAEPAQHNTLVLNVIAPDAAGRRVKQRASYVFDRKTPSHVLRAADLEPLKNADAAAVDRP